MMKTKTETFLCVILACSAIVLSIIGLYESNEAATVLVNNVYGQQVELYGKGVYAYNSTLTVSSRLGADWMGILGGVFFLFLCFNKGEKSWVNVLKTAQSTMFIYYFACLTFSISMNRLYLCYVFSLGLSVLLSIHLVSKYFKYIGVKKEAKTNKNAGISRCLAISGGTTIVIWLSMIIPCLISQNYGELLGVLTTEVTYAIDLGLLCPLMIICAKWIRNKNDNGYKLAPILLYILFSVGPMVILQNFYCIKLGIDIPLTALIGTVLSFVFMGIFAIVYLKKSIGFLELHKSNS